MNTVLDALRITVGSSPRSADHRPTGAGRHAKEGWLIAGLDLVAIAVATISLRDLSVGSMMCSVALLVTSSLNGTYRKPRLATSTLLELKSIVQTASVPLVAAATLAGLGQFSPSTIRFAAFVVPAIVAGRVVCFRLLRSLRLRRRWFVEPTVLVGTGRIADLLETSFDRNPRRGIEIVARLDPSTEADAARGSGADLSLGDVVAQTQATRVIIAFGSLPDNELAPWLRTLRSNPIEVFVVPRLHDFGSSSGDVRAQSCNGVPLVWLPHREWRREQVAVKRTIDVVLSLVGIVIAFPLLLGAAVAVRLTSPGPIVFRQIRLGRDGRLFTMFKFRTMFVGDDDARLTGPDRSRVTGVGAVLRRLSIDELPQLVNVLRGDMSIVGPRPELPHIVEQCLVIPGYAERHRVPVGITGWAQVNGLRGAGTSLEERVAHDNYYIDHWSLWFDAVVLIRTLRAATKGR